jgi:hypothetical protein
MFEYSITEGMPVHKTDWKMEDGYLVLNKRGNCVKIATGGVVWKLAYRCVTCGNLSDECWCYTDREALIKDRDEHKKSWHCCLDCSVKGKTPDEQRAWINEQRRHLYKSYHGHPPFVKWWDINEVIMFLEDRYCDVPWFPEGSDSECPV